MSGAFGNPKLFRKERINWKDKLEVARQMRSYVANTINDSLPETLYSVGAYMLMGGFVLDNAPSAIAGTALTIWSLNRIYPEKSPFNYRELSDITH